MTNHNRRAGPEMRIALTGEVDGVCDDEPAAPAARRMGRDSGSEASDNDDEAAGSSGDDQEEGNRVAGKLRRALRVSLRVSRRCRLPPLRLDAATLTPPVPVY